MSEQIKVSVIIPAYNCAKFIAQALDSVRAQSFQDYEIIVVDDGSTDSTSDVIQKNDCGVNYIRQDNSGPAAARNRGIKEAQGQYIAFLDADDVWHKDKLAAQVSVLDQKSDVGFVYSDNHFIDRNGQNIEDYVRQIKLVRGNILIDFFCDFFLMIPGIMVRKNAVDAIGPFDEDLKVGEDFDFLLRLCQSYACEVVDQKLWSRRVISESLSRQDYARAAQNDLDILYRFIRLNPAFYQEYRKKIHHRLADDHFVFAYRYLERGRNGKAFIQLCRAFRYQKSLKVLKNMLLCLIPYPLRCVMKGRSCRK